jgi:hypothetical protein
VQSVTKISASFYNRKLYVHFEIALRTQPVPQAGRKGSWFGAVFVTYARK